MRDARLDLTTLGCMSVPKRHPAAGAASGGDGTAPSSFLLDNAIGRAHAALVSCDLSATQSTWTRGEGGMAGFRTDYAMLESLVAQCRDGTVQVGTVGEDSASSATLERQHRFLTFLQGSLVQCAFSRLLFDDDASASGTPSDGRKTGSSGSDDLLSGMMLVHYALDGASSVLREASGCMAASAAGSTLPGHFSYASVSEILQYLSNCGNDTARDPAALFANIAADTDDGMRNDDDDAIETSNQPTGGDWVSAAVDLAQQFEAVDAAVELCAAQQSVWQGRPQSPRFQALLNALRAKLSRLELATTQCGAAEAQPSIAAAPLAGALLTSPVAALRVALAEAEKELQSGGCLPGPSSASSAAQEAALSRFSCPPADSPANATEAAQAAPPVSACIDRPSSSSSPPGGSHDADHGGHCTTAAALSALVAAVAAALLSVSISMLCLRHGPRRGEQRGRRGFCATYATSRNCSFGDLQALQTTEMYAMGDEERGGRPATPVSASPRLSFGEPLGRPPRPPRTQSCGQADPRTPPPNSAAEGSSSRRGAWPPRGSSDQLLIVGTAEGPFRDGDSDAGDSELDGAGSTGGGSFSSRRPLIRHNK